MSIVFLPDRYPKAELERSFPEVATALRERWAMVLENSRKRVAWVGIAKTEKEGAVFFLPHGSPSSTEDRERFAKITMRAIVRFARENKRGGEAQDRESTTQAALVAELAADYRDHGLFSTREKLRSRGDGKPDWARTVKTEIAFPASNGAPIYCDIRSTRYSSLATNIVALIQAKVLEEIHDNHGWWLDPYFGSRIPPKSQPALEWSRDIWPSLLKRARRDLYQRRAIRLVGLLLDYLERTKETGSGLVICGLSDFSSMWEAMLRDTLDNVEMRWNDSLPSPYYFRADGGSDGSGRMEVDIFVRKEDFILVLDAKYYAASSATTSPGVQDFTKQIIYRQALECTGKLGDVRVGNAFLFPGVETSREPFQRAEFVLTDGSIAPNFSPVQCQYVSMQDVVEGYASRCKLIDQTWLEGLVGD